MYIYHIYSNIHWAPSRCSIFGKVLVQNIFISLCDNAKLVLQLMNWEKIIIIGVCVCVCVCACVCTCIVQDFKKIYDSLKMNLFPVMFLNKQFTFLCHAVHSRKITLFVYSAFNVLTWLVIKCKSYMFLKVSLLCQNQGLLQLYCSFRTAAASFLKVIFNCGM